MLVTIMDTETTGLIDNPAKRLAIQPEIISFASVDVTLTDGKIFNEYYKVFKPQNRVSPEITRITGFTNEELSKHPTIDAQLDEIIQKLEAAPLIIGQNVRFDMDMVEFECLRYKKSIQWPMHVDLVQHTIYLRGYRLSLTNLHQELFGKPFEEAHRANVDVLMTARCAIEMWKRGML